MFECINRALELKDAITRFSENDMELNGWVNGEGDEDTSDVEVGRIGEEMVRTTHPHSLFFPSILIFLLRSVFFWCLQLCTSLENGHIFTPNHRTYYE